MSDLQDQEDEDFDSGHAMLKGEETEEGYEYTDHAGRWAVTLSDVVRLGEILRDEKVNWPMAQWESEIVACEVP